MRERTLNIFYFLLYNIIIVPLLFFVSHIMALFHSKFRRGIVGRYTTHRRVRKFIQDVQPVPRSVLLLHCASLGEFEHVKPFIRELKNQFDGCHIVVMFFSPSGYENVESYPGVDLFVYCPFDWWLPIWRFYYLLRPGALLVTKHDVWPNQLWLAQWMGVPRFLINASLHNASSRLNPIVRFFLQPVYHNFDCILTISEADRRNFTKLVPFEKLKVTGDTKYDQVILRSEESKRKKLFPETFWKNKKVLVCGSTWPEDETHLIPVIKKLIERFVDLRVIICPHEPTPSRIKQLQEHLYPLPNILYTEIEAYVDQPVVLINRIGLLANLYSIARVAYVGGGFKQNVHNVLEAAVYGIPVLFGPVIQKSRETQLLKRRGGGVEVTDGVQIEKYLKDFFEHEANRRQRGEIARKVVEENSGATRRMVDAILPFLEASNSEVVHKPGSLNIR